MVGNDNYKSALKFNALFFYGRALDEEERRLLKAVSVRAVFSALVTCAGNVSPPAGA
jgi:hypothetical protein